jgi:hypothetical protein
MYPDFLALPELTLECLRQESHINACKAECYRLARYTMGPRPSGLTTVRSAIKAVLLRAYLRLKPKPGPNSLPASLASPR